MEELAQWETLDQCNKNYCKPISKYITCEEFGYTDGMDGSCWWCQEMTPYQWHMCFDESHVRNLMYSDKISREDAIKIIGKSKNNIK